MFRYVVLGVDGVKKFLLGHALHLVFVDESLVEFFAGANAGNADRVFGTLAAELAADGGGKSELARFYCRDLTGFGSAQGKASATLRKLNIDDA